MHFACKTWDILFLKCLPSDLKRGKVISHYLPVKVLLKWSAKNYGKICSGYKSKEILFTDD